MAARRAALGLGDRDAQFLNRILRGCLMTTPLTTLLIDDLSWSPHDMRRGRRAGDDLLRHIVLEARDGEFVGLIGPNGSGKTSLLRCAFRYTKPRQGRVMLDGSAVWSHSARWAAQRVAVLLQDAPEDFGLSVAEVVAMGRVPHKRLLEGTTPDDAAQVERALRYVELDDARDRLFASLSGGEKTHALPARAR